MKHITKHIEAIREKPEHIRKQVALGTAGALTAFIAFVWLTSGIATGAFAINIKPKLDEPQLAVAPASSGTFGSLVGAVSAAFGGERTGASRVEVVGAKEASVQNQKKVEAEPTILPF